ncbi:hypothetical protein MWU54_13215 [Marivita sp. S6314]|uniref:hypothetical protein n=1 Tax=Marivita sp. S6314 TaxID=2926406 RepID=UPI001FF62530|nr:hypothetical protein [Marivita sp. S6314]MCK0150994.1 hypothetical protein [Marivita sp. S6314]
MVTKLRRDDVCRTVIPYVSRAMANQCVAYQRLPLTRDYVDWVMNDTDQLTVALDEVKGACIILVATRGQDPALCAARLANIATDLVRDYDVHTVFWNGSDVPIAARDFLQDGCQTLVPGVADELVVPRKVHLRGGSPRKTRRAKTAQLDHWLLQAMRAHVLSIDPGEIEMMENEERRAKTAPMRLSAWVLSIATALLATPLAIPLMVHNLVRGEDVKSGALALGVAGFYATLAQTGMVPGLAEFL